MTESPEVLEHFARPGIMTDLASKAHLLEGVPDTPEEIAAMVQGLLLHPHWAAAYGVDVPAERQVELQSRGAEAIVDGIRAIDDRPLTEPREPGQRFLGNCRDFSTLTTAFLRRAHRPARARCGFGGYFQEGKWVDHWIVEHWNGARWQALDPQIDAFQREIIGLEPNPGDLPAGCFLTAADAWLRCRRGEVNGGDFGILDMWGEWFIAGNVGRDLAALNKVEMLPWDDWGALAGDETHGSSDELVDEIAALIMTGDTAAIRARYEADADLRVPSTVMSLGPDGDWIPQRVAELS